ncbi:succinate dehydrogenase / fumarate reductase membrane anchor subunit [Devosia enhydra]|uniref:Succinate dehydrogenase hydrophobic membrane anchor subunit n=1 Tax=Devosia enhydra TaxID=665118 RepID=A0A1K2HYW7_9HYPH|nr:succinate dehydrogenase, hydrophobic membrane anchor protein [Devosia enhydra]SFZ85273.1 succinate dehydrogenase / fumarate reductase membrane anchor subunit [Devosia enhydra]
MREQLITKDTIADPRTRYGAAKASTRHFMTQRVTGAINIVFLLLLLFVVVRLAGADRAGAVALIGTPWIGLPLALLIVNVAIHIRNGMRDVLEDYFAGSTYTLLMTLTTLFSVVVGALGALCVLKLVFWG